MLLPAAGLSFHCCASEVCGSHSNATRASLGIVSLSNSSRLPPSSERDGAKSREVSARPRQAIYQTGPDGIVARKNDGNRFGGVLCSPGLVCRGCNQQVYFETDQFIGQAREAIELIVSGTILESEAFAFNIAERVESRAGMTSTEVVELSGRISKPTDLRYLCPLLRVSESHSS